MEQLSLPWDVETPQKGGRRREKVMAKENGARLHPNSGAGRIKRDFSTDTELFEAKTAGKTHRLNAEDLLDLYRQAAIQDKEPVYLVEFDNGIQARIGLSWKKTTS